MEKLLEVKDLKVSFFTDLGETQAVKDAGFAIEEGDFFGIVGESGSGKSVTTKSILRLGPSNCKIMGGEILFQGDTGQLRVSAQAKYRSLPLRFFPFILACSLPLHFLGLLVEVLNLLWSRLE